MKKRSDRAAFFGRIIDYETQLSDAWKSAKSGDRSAVAKVVLILLALLALAVLFAAFPEFFQNR